MLTQTMSSSTVILGKNIWQPSSDSSIDNLNKTEFCKAHVQYLGHIVGQNQRKPIDVKVKAISDFPVPSCRNQLMRFLGMAE